MRFLVDMPLSPGPCLWLREQEHECVHASLVGLAAARDDEIMERALREERVVLTADLEFARMLALTQADGPGVVLFRGGNYSEAEARYLLGKVLETVEEEQLAHSVTVVDRRRIRRTRLPIDRHR